MPESSSPYGGSPYGGLSGRRPERGYYGVPEAPDQTQYDDGGGPDYVDPGGAGTGGRKRRRRRIIGFTALGLVLVVIAGILASWFWASSKITHVGPLDSYATRPAQGVGTNWLLTGSDGRSTLTPQQVAQFHTGTSSAISGARTDTIMILHYGASGPDLVSIPRDSYVEIPGYTDSKGVSHSGGHNKINAAYDLGGPQLLVHTVEQNFGIRIDHYMEIGFLGIVNMVNELGGVNMCLPKAIHDAKSGANLNAGCQSIGGTQALAFVRSRYSLPNSDISRMSDQQNFIKALVSGADSPGVYLNPFTFYPFVGSVLDSVAMDDGTGLSDLLDMAWHARSISSSGGVSGTMPIANEGYDVSGVGSAVEIDQSRAAQVISALNQDKPIPAGLLNYLA